MKNVLSPISVTSMTTNDFNTAPKKSEPPEVAKADSPTTCCPTRGPVAISAIAVAILLIEDYRLQSKLGWIENFGAGSVLLSQAFNIPLRKVVWNTDG